MSLLEAFERHSELEYTHMKLGLARVRELLQTLGDPQNAYPSVLIAGTNGKGSVGRMLEAVLFAAGHKVGLYTSPHLQKFNERIRLGGVDVSNEAIEEALRFFREKGILEEAGVMRTPQGEVLTWFEKITVLAFEVFRRANIRLALLEVGLGGRLDATNVVEPIASSIVSIGLDHMQILGNSIFEIAREKAGVVRAGKETVLGSMAPEVREFLVQAAHLTGAKPVLAGLPKGDNSSFAYEDFHDLKLALMGRHQWKNAAVAIELLKILRQKGFDWEEKHLRDGFLRVSNPGRLEFFPTKPPILLDGAHNVPAMEALVEFLRVELKGRPLTVVMGMMQDKDFQGAVKVLSSLNPLWVFSEIPHPRSYKIEAWQNLSRGMKLVAHFDSDPRSALETARRMTPPQGLILVTGSLHWVGLLRPLLTKIP